MKIMFEAHELDLIVSALRGAAGSLLGVCESPVLHEADQRNIRYRGERMRLLADEIDGGGKLAAQGMAPSSINCASAPVDAEVWRKQQAERGYPPIR